MMKTISICLIFLTQSYAFAQTTMDVSVTHDVRNINRFMGNDEQVVVGLNDDMKSSDADVAILTDAGVANDTIYKSQHLIIKRVSDHVYQHISFLSTQTFGRVDCNGMVVINKRQAIIFDTPTDHESSVALITYLTKILKVKIAAIIPTHFHDDCVGGLETFHKNNIPSYASIRTITLLKDKGNIFSKPIRAFSDSLTLTLGNKKVYIKYFGEGHTVDNVVAYYPQDEVVFGGCLIKSMGATKGNLEDANVAAWSETVKKVRAEYPNTKTVIPGHGKIGGPALFDYTIKLFE